MLRAMQKTTLAQVRCVVQVRHASSPPQPESGSQSAVSGGSGGNQVHFRLTPQTHPLGKEKLMWDNPTQNHVWEKEELEVMLKKEKTTPSHQEPRGVLDRVTYWVVRGCYHAFNTLTGFSKKDPTPQSMVYRVLILESIAGCPGMVAAGIRHFRSLRHMERDNGWIHTLLEEAENERMHLLVFMTMFSPGLATRLAVMSMQCVMVTALTVLYVIRPSLVHRFVGYLEETAVATYVTVIDKMETPGTKLHTAWSELPAPVIAKNYWRLPEDAMFLEVVKQICADEMHHRDVNHEFANLKKTDTNPFVETHIKDADSAAAKRMKTDKQ